MEVAFITTNTHKFEEVVGILAPYRVTLVHVNEEYEENHDADLEEIVRSAVSKLAYDHNQPVVIEDTGLYFEAYPGFPGALPKFVIQTLGVKGIFKLLDGESRRAYFRTVAGYCEPGGQPQLFEGFMHGEITTQEYDKNKDVMPYDRIFIPDGRSTTISGMSVEEKNSFSQRAEAFQKFGEYMNEGE